VGHNASLRDDHISKESIQPNRVRIWQSKQMTKNALFIVSDSELEMTGNDTLLLVIASGIASEFEDLSSQVFEDRGQIN